MDAPQYQAPPTDPAVTALAEKAKTDDVAALQNTAAIDTASIMARYGTMRAISGATTPAAA